MLDLFFRKRCVEPKKRMIAGKFGWAVHRFPIKGGKTVEETIIREFNLKIRRNITMDNPILDLFSK